MNSSPIQEPEDKTSGSATGGLYKNVKVPTRMLDIVILGLLLIVVVFTVIGLLDPGFTVRFDARGGSDVESVKLQYGETIPEPEPPTREGYDFRGWFMDENYSDSWDFAAMTVSDNITLYAAWEPKASAAEAAE